LLRDRPLRKARLGDETDAPPEKLTLAFATADLVIVGWTAEISLAPW